MYMYMVNLEDNLQKNEEKGISSPISTILIKEKHLWYVCVGLQHRSSKVQFYLILC